jgi:hypothetical protein
VVVRKDFESGAGLVEPNRGVRQLEWMASLGKIGVLVADVDNVVPQLRAPHQDWIVSTVRATITTVIQQPPAESLSVGRSIEFLQDGGELTIDGRRVRAVVPYADPHAAGNRYLLFVRRNSANAIPEVVGFPGQLHVYEPTSYLVDAGGRLQSLCKGEGCQWPQSENGVELTEAIRRLTSRKRTLPVLFAGLTAPDRAPIVPVLIPF